MPITKQIRDLNFGNRELGNSGTSRHAGFNNTQKINIGNHLEGLGVLESRDINRCYNDQYEGIKKNASSNKFRLMLNKSKENSNKYV